MKSPLSLLIKQKGSDVYCVKSSQKVADCVHEMNAAHIGAVIVKQGDDIVGIFTERDVLRRVLGEGNNPQITLVSDVMTTDLQTVSSDTTVENAMLMMTKHRFRHIPVVDNGELKGLISIGDLTRWALERQSENIQELMNYINQ